MPPEQLHRMLFGELNAHTNWLRGHALEKLEAKGVSRETAIRSHLALGRVEFGADGFDFAATGVKAFILPVIDCHRYADLVAWAVAEPTKCKPYLGTAFALGQDQIFNPGTYAFDSKLAIHRAPFHWLQADGKGIVILQPKMAYGWLQHAPGLLCEDELHGREIRRLLVPPKPRTKVFVWSQEAAA